MLKVCASALVSVAMRIPSKGYESVHGHDLKVTVCACSNTGAWLDAEELQARLRGHLERFHGRPLWETLGKEEATVEDLLYDLAGKFKGVLPREYWLCQVRASWADKEVEVTL